MARWMTILLTILIAGGCANRVMNEPLEGGDDGKGYDFPSRLPGDADDTFVVLAFSGGGTRAASLAYGVLEELRDTEIDTAGESRRLLDEVDVITAVSGGAYSAAYYGLFGDKIFEDFADSFLYKDWPSTYRSMLVNPINLWRIASGGYNRADLMADHLNRTLFEGKTFSQLSRGELPFVIINAADLNNSLPFPFIQPQFDFLCSDLNTYPVAYAVMASSAVPPAFPPTTLKNYADCAARDKAWVNRVLEDRPLLSRRFVVAQALARYAPAERMPFLRLVDGGVVDNLGVRGSMMSPVAHRGDVASMAGAFNEQRLHNVRDVLVILVNAEVYKPYEWSLNGREPGLFDTMAAAFDGAWDTLQSETIGQAKREFILWAERVNRKSDAGRPPIDVHFSAITFNQIKDPARREKFNGLGTADLAAEEVDELRALAGQLLERSPQYQAFLDAINNAQ